MFFVSKSFKHFLNHLKSYWFRWIELNKFSLNKKKNWNTIFTHFLWSFLQKYITFMISLKVCRVKLLQFYDIILKTDLSFCHFPTLFHCRVAPLVDTWPTFMVTVFVYLDLFSFSFIRQKNKPSIVGLFTLAFYSHHPWVTLALV